MASESGPQRRPLTSEEVDRIVEATRTVHDALTRWAPKVGPPPTLKKLMRHTDIQTTLTYYVSLDAEDVAAELWSQHQPGVGTYPQSPRANTMTPSQETTKPVDSQRVIVILNKCPH